MMGANPSYLYRGTTARWPGNESLLAAGITCTTTDPLVATLFAIACRNHGPGVVLLAPKGPLERLIGPSNPFEQIECAVNLEMLPGEFARRAVHRMDVDTSLAILAEPGFSALPVRINGAEALAIALQCSHDLGERLSPDRVDAYNRLALERAT